jgi:hypothetical protein
VLKVREVCGEFLPEDGMSAQIQEAYCDGECDFFEDYYGWQCRKCPMFFAYGLAPWEQMPDDLFAAPVPTDEQMRRTLGDGCESCGKSLETGSHKCCG